MGRAGEARYKAAPKVPSEIAERWQAFLGVLSGTETMSGGARRAKLCRLQFQTVTHRALASAMEALKGKKPGRKPVAPEMRAMRKKVARLEREIETLRARNANYERMLEVASETLKTHGEMREVKRKGRRKRTVEEKQEVEAVGRRSLLTSYREMRELGMAAVLAGALIGKSPETMRVWGERAMVGKALVRPRGPRRKMLTDVETEALLEWYVRETEGLIGATMLVETVTEVTRREAGRVKKEAVTEMERERKAKSGRVWVQQPGVVRNLDAMYLWTTEGMRFVLTLSDGCVPFGTSAYMTEHYDDEAVSHALRVDFEKNGVPYVVRMDRAKAHRGPATQRLLDDHQVVVLQGPPHHPGFYGQHERQNRDYRHWLEAKGPITPDELRAWLPKMLVALNDHWKRRSLGSKTPREAWEARRPIMVNRAELVTEVKRISAKVTAESQGEEKKLNQSDRFAIEAALQRRGLLVVQR